MTEQRDGLYRKKPLVIEAEQYNGPFSLDEMYERWGKEFSNAYSYEKGFLSIHTLEGDHHASVGDWIIKGVKGEFYPCKPDIFTATYERALSHPQSQAQGEAVADGIPPLMCNGETKRDPALRACIERWGEDQNRRLSAAVDRVFDAPCAASTQQSEPIKGERYEAGDWSMRNYEAWREDQGAAPAPSASPAALTDRVQRDVMFILNVLQDVNAAMPTSAAHRITTSNAIEKARALLAAQPSETRDAVDLIDLRKRLLAPREIVRDEDGLLVNPALPILDESDDVRMFLAAFGVECCTVSMESDCDDEALRDAVWAGEKGCGEWTPTPPDGEGWILSDIYDTEDGPSALFIRQKPKDPGMSRRERQAACATDSAAARDAGAVVTPTFELIDAIVRGDQPHLQKDCEAWKRLRKEVVRWFRAASVAGVLPVANTCHVPQLSQAEIDVLAERRRHVAVEGWTPDHDDEHDDGSLAKAAGCYALASMGYYTNAAGEIENPESDWPWDPEWWKPTTPRRMLEKAASMCIAEMERIDRAALAGQREGGAA